MASVPMQVSASRVRLARVALDAALAVPGVLGAEAGLHGLRVTADAPTGLRRVSVTPQVNGRYAVDLCLVAAMVALMELGQEVRREVQARAREDGLGDQLGAVNVEFAGVRAAENPVVDSNDPDGKAAGGVAGATAPATLGALSGTPVAVPVCASAQRVSSGAPSCSPDPSSADAPGKDAGR